MANVWYYLKDKKTFGPVGPAELKRLTSTGGLLPSDLIRKEGMKNWARASSAKGLFDTPPPPQSAPPPPSESVAISQPSEAAEPIQLTWNDRFLNG